MKRGTCSQSHTQGEHDVKIKTEIGVMLLQAKERQSLPANHQKLGVKHGLDCSLEPSGVSVTETFISDF